MNSTELRLKILKIFRSCETDTQLKSCSNWLQNHLYKFFSPEEYQFLQANLDHMYSQIESY